MQKMRNEFEVHPSTPKLFQYIQLYKLDIMQLGRLQTIPCAPLSPAVDEKQRNC